MTLTIPLDLVVLATTCAILWHRREELSQLWHGLVAAYLRRQAERDLGVRIVYVVGDVTRHSVAELVDDVTETPPRIPIAVIIDTAGGSAAAAEVAVHCLQRRLSVQAFVPVRARSSGTHIACAADTIYMAPHAHIGPCDASVHVAPDWLRSGPVLQARARDLPEPLVRSEAIQEKVLRSIRGARLARGDSDEVATHVGRVLTSGELGDHDMPIFIEQALELPLPAALLFDPRWARLARHRSLSLPECDR